MKKINILSKSVYNRIAAGEVVDRPYSVVKELIENSLDAGATNIEIYIEEGGKQYIKVADNGCGIDKDDLRAAFMPHATSKISKPEDLDNISTLGFRGEALASIAAVARVELTSATKGNGAFKIYATDGKTSAISPASLQTGTEVVVRNLFYNTPVRAKFMKAEKKEETDITNFVTRYILGNPEISFRYFIDGVLVMQSNGEGLEEAITEVYGSKILPQCYKISAEKDGIVVSGYISNQNFFKPNKTYQSLFLNGRYITNFTINLAISNAYDKYTMKRQFPFYVLNIDVPSEIVDVNVHPNKSDVRFTDSKYIFSVVYSIISSVLDGSAKAAPFVLNSQRVPEVDSTMPQKPKESSAEIEKRLIQSVRDTESHPVFQMPDFGDDDPEDEKYFPPKEIRERDEKLKNPSDDEGGNKEFDFMDPLEDVPLHKYFPKSNDNILHVTNDYSSGLFAHDTRVDEAYARYLYEQQMIEFESCKFKGNLFNTYLIYEIKDTVYLIDQHAAHERLIYDKLCERLRNKTPDRQDLANVYIFDCSPQEFDFIKNNRASINRMGFHIEPFGMRAYRVDCVPFDLQQINIGEFIDDFLSMVDELKDITIEDVLQDKIAKCACKHAVKAGMSLSEDEVAELFKMLKGDMGLKCPHGRPVCVTFTKKDLDKAFKRIV